MNAISPEVARHQRVRDHAVVAFNSDRRRRALVATRPKTQRLPGMSTLLILIILLVLLGGGGFYAGGPRVGGSLGGLILLILLFMALTGRL